jgi:DEAD/DEAH box helicase domain-containing protein
VRILRITDSEDVLKKLGYDYIKIVEPALEPPRTNTRFRDIAPELEKLGLDIAKEYLYEHQLQALNFLREGYNVVLKSGTGSGKTESWYFYFHEKARRESFKAIAIYPTLALANDQIKRISLYASSAGIPVAKIDAMLRDEIIQKIGRTGLRRELTNSRLVVTNPAFLFHEVKKLLLTPSACLLDFRKINLVVVDEFDFYSPRSIALILGMLKILIDYSDIKPQIVVLTATLANPEDMCRYLEEVTGRRCAVVDGKQFRVENRLYIVLGKNIENVWRIVRKYREQLISRNDIDRDVVEALDNLELFKKNAYKVLQYLEALGFEVPSISIDIKEIFSRYVEDNGVTLVFTRSIARADEVARGFKDLLGDAVAAHHHLVPKKEREFIEERARRGEVKIIVSPRTLTQGIDIGTVVRVVHLGLPENVREFLQREGRKGRRREIEFSESIVIPSTRWDWELLTKGIDVFYKWLSLPLEKTIINPRNKYIYLFTSLAKILSPWYRQEFTEEEFDVLKRVRVVKKEGSIDHEKAKWIWERLNFYEFGPPYGIKRYLEDNEKLIPLEPIGHCDLVERFQKGCIDMSQDAIVKHVEAGKSSRLARAVVESKLSKFNFFRDDAIAEAVEEYRYIKTSWGEEPSILRDIARGKLSSYVLAVVYPPRQGFGEYLKIPNRVIWYLVASRPRVARLGDKHIVTYDRKTIYVPVETAGMYRDYTYGTYVEADEREDATLLRLGLAYLMVFLRKFYGIPFETIMYSVGKIGEKKFIELHEPEAAGLLESIDWSRVRKDLESYTPEDLDLVLLLQLDDIAYSDLLSLGLDLNILKILSSKIVDYLQLREKISAIFRGLEISIPKPSKALKIVTLDSIAHIVNEEEVIRKAIVGLAVFDGETVERITELYTMLPFTPPPKTLRDFEVYVEDMVVYNNMKLIVLDKEASAKELEKIGLKRLARTIKDYGYSLREKLSKLGIELISLSAIGYELSVKGLDIDLKSLDIADLHRIYTEYSREGAIKELPIDFKNSLERYLETSTKLLYVLHLVIENIEGKNL